MNTEKMIRTLESVRNADIEGVSRDDISEIIGFIKGTGMVSTGRMLYELERKQHEVDELRRGIGDVMIVLEFDPNHVAIENEIEEMRDLFSMAQKKSRETSKTGKETNHEG